jgi:hypothetical protein
MYEQIKQQMSEIFLLLLQVHKDHELELLSQVELEKHDSFNKMADEIWCLEIIMRELVHFLILLED